MLCYVQLRLKLVYNLFLKLITFPIFLKYIYFIREHEIFNLIQQLKLRLRFTQSSFQNKHENVENYYNFSI